MYDYDRQTSEEVSFQEGSQVDIYDKDDPDWFLVGVHGQYGFAPSNYLEEGGVVAQSPAVVAQQQAPGALRPESITSLPPPAPPLPTAVTHITPAPALFTPAKSSQPDFTDHTALESDHDTDDNALPTPQRPNLPNNEPPESRPVMAPRPTAQQPTETNRYTSRDVREVTPEPQQAARPYRTWSVHEVDGKKKKKKGTLGLGSDEISWAPEKSSESIQTWPINSLLRYSAEKKHIFIDLQGPLKAASFDFHAGSSDAAQAILSVLGELAGAARMPGIREVAGALNAPLPALPQNSGLARKERESGFPLRENSDDEQVPLEHFSGSEKIATVMYDFEAQGDDEVTVRAGSKVVVLDDKASADWWKIRSGRKEGVIPADYLEVVSTKRSKKRSSLQENGTGNSTGRGERERERSSSRNKAQELKPQATGGKSKPDPNRIRSWTDRSKSFKVDAQLLGCSDGKIHLHKSNGVKISVPISKMSLEDIEYVEHKVGRTLREGTSSSETQDPATKAREEKEKRRKEAARAATAAASASASDFDWFDFFLGCGCDPNVCQRYTSAFEREGLTEDDITSLEAHLLRNLGLKEGDILKIGRAVDAKLGRKRDAPASFDDVLVRDSAASNGSGLLTGPGGELKNNTRRGRPERATPSNDTVDPEALRKAVTARDDKPAEQVTEVAPVKPMRPQSTGAPPSAAMEDLSLLVQPLIPTPAPVISATPAFSVPPAQTSQAPPQAHTLPPQQTGQQQIYPSPQLLQSIQQMQPQRTASLPAVPPFMPQTSFGSAIVAHKTGGGDLNQFVPPPLYTQQTGYQQHQNIMMQQAPAAPYQDPFKTGSAAPYQDPFKTGFAQAQPTGMQAMPIGAAPNFGLPMQQTGFVQRGQQMAYVPIQQTGFMPQPTGFLQPLQQPQYNAFQPQNNMYNVQSQQTGFNPAQPFGSSNLPAFGGQLTSQQTGFPQQPQQTGYNAFNGFGGMPAPQAQPQMSAGMLKLQQMMAEAQQQTQGSTGFQQQPQSQGFQPVSLGRSSSAGPLGRKANLGNATADNPFGL